MIGAAASILWPTIYKNRGGGGNFPPPPPGFAYLVNADGAYIVNADGAYILAKV